MGLDSDLFSLGSLGRNWDSYDGEPPTQAAMDRCRQLQFVPCSDGGIQIELHSGAVSAEIAIDRGGEITFVAGGPTDGVAVGPQATPDTTLLQERAGKWHRARFPRADQTLVLLKAMEELGELAEAVSDVVGRNSTYHRKALLVPTEAADVVVALMVLLDRWYPSDDLLAEVERKLTVLEDPESGHRSAAERRVVAAPTGNPTEDDQ